MPVGNATDTEKQPLLVWRSWRCPPSMDAYSELVARPRFRQAGLGLLTGLSGLVVVDCDEPGLGQRVERLLGKTPVVVASPSGGQHLYYRATPGQRGRNLRAHMGMKIDIKAKGGFVVAPPTIRQTGRHAGKAYAFVRGSWDDIAVLPTLLRDIEAALAPFANTGGDEERRLDRRLYLGERNNGLLQVGLRTVKGLRDLDELLPALQDANQLMAKPPLAEREVEAVARSAHRMEAEGRNWVGSSAVAITRAAFDEIGCPFALQLLVALRFHHGGRDGPFAVAARRMAEETAVPGLAENRIRAATARLLELGYLERVARGGRGPGTPHLYALGRPPDRDPTVPNPATSGPAQTPKAPHPDGWGACATRATCSPRGPRARSARR